MSEANPGIPSATGTVDPMLVATVRELFGSLCTPQALRQAEQDGWAPALWDAVAQAGLPWIGLPEQDGGEGGTLADLMAVLREAGAYALPLPLAETALAGRLLAAAGLPVPRAPLTVVPGDSRDSLRLDGDGRLTGTAHRVPWARAVDRIVALLPYGDTGEADEPGEPGAVAVVVVAAADAVSVTAMTNLAGEPRDTVTFDGAVPERLVPCPAPAAASLLPFGALTRAVLMAGALRRVCELTVAYTREREQFGRPIARFQAVQQHVVTVVQETAAVSVAAEAAVRSAGEVEIATAKVMAGHAVHTAVRAAHQAHGAMGVTQEYPLHHVTRRLRSWRCEYGDERLWEERLGGITEAAGADGLYPLITAGSEIIADMAGTGGARWS